VINKFCPKLYKKDIYSIDLKALWKKGFRTIIVDLDNTLVPYTIEIPTKRVLDWIEDVKKLGFTLIIVSNNNKDRVSKFVLDLNVDGVYYKAMKPTTITLKRILNNYKLKKNEIVMIGDQLLTDILAGNRFGVYTILVDPILKKREMKITSFNRNLEKIIYKRLAKKNLLIQGEYDEK
jgi:HAD superfamily phosphatase (TIGR01668 family)